MGTSKLDYTLRISLRREPKWPQIRLLYFRKLCPQKRPGKYICDGLLIQIWSKPEELDDLLLPCFRLGDKDPCHQHKILIFIIWWWKLSDLCNICVSTCPCWPPPRPCWGQPCWIGARKWNMLWQNNIKIIIWFGLIANLPGFLGIIFSQGTVACCHSRISCGWKQCLSRSWRNGWGWQPGQIGRPPTGPSRTASASPSPTPKIKFEKFPVFVKHNNVIHNIKAPIYLSLI